MRLQDYAAGEMQVEANDLALGNLLKDISSKVVAGRRRAVANLFEIAERYEAARSHLTPGKLKAFLSDVCGVPRAQATEYAALLPNLGEHREMLVQQGVAADFVLKLAIARSDVREEALRMVESGRSVQARELAAIRRDIDHANLRKDGVLDPRRRAALPRHAAKIARDDAVRLVSDIEAFARELLPWLDLPSFNPFVSPHKENLERNAASAARLSDRLAAIGQTRELFENEGGWIWRDAIGVLRLIAAGQVSDNCDWDPEEERRSFAAEHCSEIAYNDEIVAALARASGFIIDPRCPREVKDLEASGRQVLTDNPGDATGRSLTVLELCAGGGGQAIGLHAAGFRHVGLVEWNRAACATISLNRPDWPVINADMRDVNYERFEGVDLIAGGVPCTPFSAQGLREGREDSRDLFAEAVNIVKTVRPKAIMLENVLGLFHARHLPYRLEILAKLSSMGYEAEWREIEGPDFGMAQRRKRTILVGMRKDAMHRFRWPEPLDLSPRTVADTLRDLMAANGWKHVDDWAEKAAGHCNTLVGGSDGKSSPDLGRENGRRAWLELAVNPHGVALEAPGPDVGPAGEPGDPRQAHTYPRLTLRMLARLQEFPDEWRFSPPARWQAADGFDSRGDMALGSPMPTFRQIANAFPPAMARALGIRIRRALTGYGPDLGEALKLPYDVLRPRFDMRDAYRTQPDEWD